MARTIEIGPSVTVRQLADQLEVPANQLVGGLFKNGVVATINEKVDFDTVAVLVTELGLDVEVKLLDPPNQPVDEKPVARSNPKLKDRPPVVAIMGHVDHGKTTLIDKVCQTTNLEKESGGITQHISAHQAEHNGRSITFLDTPGHETFAAIRQHGAILTDVIVIVVAADDGVGPQTVEVLRFAKATEAKIIVAANKMDKPGANIERLKTQLAEHGLLVEDRGGQVVCLPLSAKKGLGLDELLDMILLVSDTEELKADFSGLASGRVIDAYSRKGLGLVAMVLIEEGILRSGNYVAVGSTYGRVRTMNSVTGLSINEATPSTPVLISGLKDLPDFGDSLCAVANEKTARKLASQKQSGQEAKMTGMTNSELLRIIDRRAQLDEVNLIIKTDVRGSLGAITDSIHSFGNDEVAARIVSASVGAVSEKDIWLAKTSGATIHCFHLDISPNIQRLAQAQEVTVKSHNVIYELLDEVKSALEALLSPEIVQVDLGKLKVQGVFKSTRNSLICGGKLTSGKLTLPAQAEITRDGKEFAVAGVASLKKGESETNEIVKGELCGIGLTSKTKINLQIGDTIEFYRQDSKPRKLSTAS